MKRVSSILFVVVLFWIAAVGNAQAATSTWTAVSAGYWTNADNWAGGVPGSADDVVFDSSSSQGCTVDVDIVISSLNVTNGYSGTITFTQGISADMTISNDFYLGSDSVIIPTYSSTNADGTGRVITVKGNATIDGTINGNTKGFAQQQGPGYGSGICGGSHGGKGGGSTGPTYGSLTQPTALGSGGLHGSGGGAIKLDVTGTLALDGSIAADGQDAFNGGSGGSIWLIANTFTGNGIISADGGSGSQGNGGGGRVSIECTNTTWTGAVSVAGGKGSAARGQPGTLWYRKMFPISGDVIMDRSCQYYFPNLTTNYWNLTITNESWVEFHQGNLTITNLVVKDSSLLTFDGKKLGTRDFDMTNLWIRGSINISNSTVYLPAQGTYDLQGDFNLLSTGATIYALGDTNAINEASGGTNGNPHGIGIAIDIGGDANIEGTIDADGQGFPEWKGPGGGAGGASHGGKGSIGATYGSLTQPTALGSGGWNATSIGAGAIKLNVTGTLALNGSITANGRSSGGNGGAGGSIWLMANTFTGNGIISADGGNGSQGNAGGGRVSIECTNSTWAGTVSVNGGTGSAARGQSGTLWYPQMFSISGDITIDTGYQYYFPNLTTNYWNLTIADVSWVEFHQGNLTITNLVVKENSILRFDQALGGTDDFDMTNLWIRGSIDISNSTVCLPAEGTYDLSGDLNLLSTGATLYALGDTDAINEASGGSTGTPHGVGVTIDIGGNATIDGTINGNIMGFPMQKGPGGGFCGAGYGGRGKGSPATYGSLIRPTALGSGGWDGNSIGGGAIKLNVTGTLALNGSITAKGGGNTAGSGGSIWLIANTFMGNGTISADAGPGTSREGGGGRVSIEYCTSTWTGTVSAATSGTNGYPGTYFLCESVCLGAGSSGCNGITLASDLSKDGGNASATNGVKLTRFVTIWNPSRPMLSWRDTSTELGTNQLDNVVTNSLSGLAANTKHKIYYDGQWTNTLTSDVSGNLTNIVITLDAERTVLVEGPARGTAIMIM